MNFFFPFLPSFLPGKQQSVDRSWNITLICISRFITLVCISHITLICISRFIKLTWNITLICISRFVNQMLLPVVVDLLLLLYSFPSFLSQTHFHFYHLNTIFSFSSLCSPFLYHTKWMRRKRETTIWYSFKRTVRKGRKTAWKRFKKKDTIKIMVLKFSRYQISVAHSICIPWCLYQAAIFESFHSLFSLSLSLSLFSLPSTVWKYIKNRDRKNYIRIHRNIDPALFVINWLTLMQKTEVACRSHILNLSINLSFIKSSGGTQCDREECYSFHSTFFSFIESQLIGFGFQLIKGNIISLLINEMLYPMSISFFSLLLLFLSFFSFTLLLFLSFWKIPLDWSIVYCDVMIGFQVKMWSKSKAWNGNKKYTAFWLLFDWGKGEEERSRLCIRKRERGRERVWKRNWRGRRSDKWHESWWLLSSFVGQQVIHMKHQKLSLESRTHHPVMIVCIQTLILSRCMKEYRKKSEGKSVKMCEWKIPKNQDTNHLQNTCI